MSRDLRERYERLLHWYPRRWRAEHGQVMLDTLEELAEAQGRTRPALLEAADIRLHGLAERATPRVAAVLTALAALLFVAQLGLSHAGIFLPYAYALTRDVACWTLLGLAVIVLIVSARRASPALAASVLLLWFAARLAEGFVSTIQLNNLFGGFDLTLSEAIPTLQAGAQLAMLAACLLAAAAALSAVRRVAARWSLAAVIALMALVAVGVISVRPLAFAVVAVWVFVAAVSQLRARPQRETLTARRHARPEAVQPRRWASTAVLALAACGGVLLTAAVAATLWPSFAGSVWSGPMAFSAFLAALAATAAPLPLLFVLRDGEPALKSRLGAAVVAGAGLVAAGGSSLLHESWPLDSIALAVGSALLGVSAALVFWRALPGGRMARVVVSVILAGATSVAALAAVELAVLITPFAAAGLGFWMHWRSRRGSGNAHVPYGRQPSARPRAQAL